MRMYYNDQVLGQCGAGMFTNFILVEIPYNIRCWHVAGGQNQACPKQLLANAKGVRVVSYMHIQPLRYPKQSMVHVKISLTTSMVPPAPEIKNRPRAETWRPVVFGLSR